MQSEVLPKPHGYAVTGIGVKPFLIHDPARAPGVRNKNGFDERTVALFTEATGRWSSPRWVPALTLWRTFQQAAAAYHAARYRPGRTKSIDMTAVEYRQAAIDAGDEWKPEERF